MDCNQIPAPPLWDEESKQQLEQYRLHIQFCAACRQRVVHEAPEKLLFDINEDPLPEEFWLGFWDSVDRKKDLPQRHRGAEEFDHNSASLRLRGGAYAAIRWAAVIIFGVLILFYGRNLSDQDRLVEVSIKLMMAKKANHSLAVAGGSEFSNYDLLDENLVRSKHGAREMLSLADAYRVTFITELIPEGNIGLKDFELRKIRMGKGGKDTASPLLSVSLNMRNAQTIVLGTKRLPESDESLLIILVGKVKQ